MTEKSLELQESELEAATPMDVVPEMDVQDADVMDNIIAAAKKMEAYDKAFTTIMNVIMKRTYAGDWVSHARAKDPRHIRSASLSGAGCDRVATILGIRETNWKEHPKQMGEDGTSYSFRYEADFTWGGLTRHAFGECSTKNKFFGYEDGKWKELTDIREDHVRKAAQRECQKDGIRRLLGLRKIPIVKLKELGFNIDLVHYVNFKDSREALEDKSGASTSDSEQSTQKKATSEKLTKNIVIREMKVHKWKDTPIIDVVTDKGEIIRWWGQKPENEPVRKLADMMAAGYLVEIEYTQKGEYQYLQGVIGGVPQ